ncbi:MAG: hypothetical protein AABX66_03575 [Nanoarchaeota archaeon]
MRKPFNILNNLLTYGFLVVLAFLLFFNNATISLTFFMIGSFIASLVSAFILKNRGVSGTGSFEFFINLFLWLNVFGEMGLFYTGITFYDKIVHFGVGILITSIVFRYYQKSLTVKKELIFLTVLGIFALWEIYEYLLLILFNYPAVGVTNNGIAIMSHLDDTMFDMIFGAIGSISTLFFKGQFK